MTGYCSTTTNLPINLQFFIFAKVIMLPQLYHVPLQVYKPPRRGRAVRKNTGTKQKWPRETQSSAYANWLSTPTYLSRVITIIHIIKLYFYA